MKIVTGKTITPETAIFFDEIQKSERAITSLKYFCETKENYRVIAAGSLLGVKLNRFESSFPVGKVMISRMFPMDFEEFLNACGKDITLFNRELQHNILPAYAADMTKYTFSPAEGAKITAIYESVPRQLARENPKFKYKEVRPNANKRDFYQPLDWLKASGMIYKVLRAEIPKSPLKGYSDENNFKVYLSDVGLLMYTSGMRYKDLLDTSDNIYKGAVAENFVMQMAISNGKNLYYYKLDAAIEIDLLLDDEEGIIPVEIKSGRHKRSTSLKNYKEKFDPRKMIRISENNFGGNDGLLSVPLYAACRLFSD